MFWENCVRHLWETLILSQVDVDSPEIQDGKNKNAVWLVMNKKQKYIIKKIIRRVAATC